MKKSAHKIIARHRRATYDYEIEDTFEAGLSLTGTEVKSLRAGAATISEAYVRVKDGQCFIYNMNIPEYSHGNRNNHEPRRVRKLLLNRAQIDRLTRKFQEQGYTGVPMELYFSNGWAKLKFGIGKGKKNYDKRQSAKKKQDRREMRDLRT